MATPSTPRLPAGERLRRAGIAAWSIIGLLILAAVTVWALLKIRIIFPPLVLALLIIYLLNPIVDWLERRRVPRMVGAIGTYVVVFGGVALIVIALIPIVSEQVRQFSQQWPAFKTETVAFVDDTARGVEERLGIEIDTAQVDCLFGSDEAPSAAECDQVTQDFRDQIGAQAGRLTEIGSSLLEALLVFILAPLIALYLIIDLPHLRRDLYNLFPATHRAEIAVLGPKVSRAIGGFFRGQLFVALIVGVLSSIGFKIIDLPFWLVIGAVAGFFNLVPLIGPFIGGGLGFLTGVISGSVSLGLKAALVELIVQQLDNHIISPNVMKRTVNLHPVTVMLALLAGGTLAGFWGVLLGVPAIAVIKLVLGHVWATRVLGVAVSPGAPPNSGAPSPPLPEESRADSEVMGGEPAADTPEEGAGPYPVPDRRS
ncbi:MAG: AI-2E family transporter [Actinomycetota bacterium]